MDKTNVEKLLSVIVVSYNNGEMIKNLIDSIVKHNDIGEGLELIISDNSTNDQVQEVVKEYPFVKYVRSGNVGFGKGNNVGFAISSAKYVLFLNPDILLVEPVFSFAINAFEKNPNVNLFGVQLIGPDGKNANSFFEVDKYGLRASLKQSSNRKKGKFYKGCMILGADLFMRRSAFEEIGKFDENIFMYREEEDVYRRLVASYGNDTITFFREKKIVHLEGGTSEGNQEGILRAFARSLDSHIYYSQKHGLSAYDVFKTRKRYYAFKSFCLIVLGKKAKASLEKKKSQILKDYCKKVKD